MSGVRVLHVDDEPDIREIVQMSLGLDPDLTVRSCASGGDALAAAATWTPDLILLDVMMPTMDGPTTLTHLRQSPRTADIPVVFMTARAQPRELDHFVSLGAEGVIAKPFDPMTLAVAVRNYVGGLGGGIVARRTAFLERVREHSKTLAAEKAALAAPATASEALERVRGIAHSIAGGAGIFGLQVLSQHAAALEIAANARLAGGDAMVEQAIATLIAQIART